MSKGCARAQRRDSAAVLLAVLSASMSILWCDSHSERLFDATESVLGIGISGDFNGYPDVIFPLLTGGRQSDRNSRVDPLAGLDKCFALK